MDEFGEHDDVNDRYGDYNLHQLSGFQIAEFKFQELVRRSLREGQLDSR